MNWSWSLSSWVTSLPKPNAKHAAIEQRNKTDKDDLVLLFLMPNLKTAN